MKNKEKESIKKQGDSAENQAELNKKQDNSEDTPSKDEVNGQNAEINKDGKSEAGSSGSAAVEKEKEPSPEQKIAELEKSNAELKDQYLRKCADFDNYRKRMIREKQEAFDFANTNLLTDLISILDDFDRALAAGVSPDGGKLSDLNPVVDGISMINKQLRNMLSSKYNLTAYGQVGDAFNHDLHEAIGSTPAAVADPVCAEVYLKGYKLKERVIRPAKVMVHMPDGSVSNDNGNNECEKSDSSENK